MAFPPTSARSKIHRSVRAVEFGDPWIDATNHRLVVTYDDVASRKTAYEGGYYVSVYAGDAVYAGPLSGCQKLLDADVQAAFDD